jgi:mycofactocin precursor
MTDHPAAPPAAATVQDTASQDRAIQDRTAADGADELYDAEVLVEEVSIDGMCGVY